MSRRAPEVRYIRPEQVRLGDYIMAHFKENSVGIVVTKTARVAKREYRGQERVMLTAQGGEIFAWVPGEKAPRITLLERPDDNEPETLFDNSEVWVFNG